MAEIKNDQRSYLSDDLIEEILTRLPVKSILRLKSVSKQWYSTLSSPDFANTHLIKSSFSHPCAPVNTLFIKSVNNHYIFSYDDDDQISGNFEDNLIELDFTSGVRKDHRLIGCCNGLVCLTPFRAEYFLIWNPAIRKMHKYASYWYSKCRYEADDTLVTTGFGYASSVDDYKYVEMVSVFEENTPSYCIIHIFSLRENRWRKIDPFHDHFVPFKSGLLVSDKLCWRACSKQGAFVLFSFDLAVERLDIIDINLDKFDLLGVMRGCLSKCNIRTETLTGDKLLHIMEPPEIVKSISLPKGLKLSGSQIIGFTKTDKFFVTGVSSDETCDFPSQTLGIVDTCTKPMQYRMLLGFDKSIEIVRYVPSLVSPFPIEEPSKA